MAKCSNIECVNEVISQEGKRAKKFCSNTCRQKSWQKNKQDNSFIKVPRSEWEKLTQGVPERQNPLINAARGRGESGINEDEVKISPVKAEKSSSLNTTSPIKKIGVFRDRREDEDVFQYAAAKSKWKLNNQ